ncbi:hypothetical protein ACRRTK_008595 [Alexandromys fortis]
MFRCPYVSRFHYPFIWQWALRLVRRREGSEEEQRVGKMTNGTGKRKSLCGRRGTPEAPPIQWRHHGFQYIIGRLKKYHKTKAESARRDVNPSLYIPTHMMRTHPQYPESPHPAHTSEAFMNALLEV